MQYVTTSKHEHVQHLYDFYFMYFIYFPNAFLLISSCGKLLRFFVYVNIYCVGAGKTTLMSISEGLDPYFVGRKNGKTRSIREEMDGRVFFQAKVGIFPFIDNRIKLLFPICTLIWRVNNYVSRRGKVLIGEMKVLLLFYKL